MSGQSLELSWGEVAALRCALLDRIERVATGGLPVSVADLAMDLFDRLTLMMPLGRDALVVEDESVRLDRCEVLLKLRRERARAHFALCEFQASG